MDPTESMARPSAWRGRLGRLARRLGLIALLVYLGTALVLAALQSQLLFPGHAAQGRPETHTQTPGGVERVELPTEAGNVVAFFGPALDPDGQPLNARTPGPALLYFYGNGESIASCLDQFDDFRELGLHVLIADYLGYGMSQGTPSETNCYRTADAALAYLKTRLEVDPSKIIVLGWSLGGGVAIDLAAREAFAGVIVAGTFTSVPDLAQTLFPWLPTSLLVRDRFDSASKIHGIKAPILVIHGSHDEIIPYAMGQQLAASGPPGTEFLRVPGAKHNDLFEVGGRHLKVRIRQFLRGVLGPRQP
jgi:fermentation-respiration switch protein FrsA (DUF1100 family)